MSEATSYAVVMTGEITEGESVVDVKHSVAMLFNVVGPKLDKMFAGKPVAVRRNVDRVKAYQICAALLDAGVIAKVKSERNVAAKGVREVIEHPSATVVDMQSRQVVAEPPVLERESMISEGSSLPVVTLKGLQSDLECPNCKTRVKVELMMPEQRTAELSAPGVIEQPSATVLELPSEQAVADSAEAIENSVEVVAETAEPVVKAEPIVEEAVDEFVEAVAELDAEFAPVAVEDVVAPQCEETPVVDAVPQRKFPISERAAKPVGASPAPVASLESFQPDLECPRCAHEQRFTHQCGLCQMDLRLHIGRLHRKERMRARRREMLAQAEA